MPSEGFFTPIFTTPAVHAAVGDRAWLEAMLEFEAALARAEARVGLIPADAASVISARCADVDGLGLDLSELGRAAVDAGNPVIPLVRALTAAVGGDAARWVHWGATSQDVLDTATSLVLRRGLALLGDGLERVASACAVLADRHRATVMTGRTLLQPAVPTTFGLKAAGWLIATDAAADGLRVADARLAVELGGAAGTLSSLGSGPEGLAVVAALADELGLAEPVLPWHTDRTRVAEVATALGVAAGVMGKIALDVTLLMQAELGEAAEPAAPGRGGSSAMPHKRNPVAGASVSAAVRRAHGLVGVVLGAMAQEHERGAGGWQAEWQVLGELVDLTGGAVERVAEVLADLEVDADRMRANLEARGGLPLTEQVAMALGAQLGHRRAHEVVEAVVALVLGGAYEGDLRRALLADPVVAEVLSVEQVDAALDPAQALGAAPALVDRALAAHRASGGRR